MMALLGAHLSRSTAQMIVGYDSSLAIDSNDNLHVTYYDKPMTILST